MGECHSRVHFELKKYKNRYDVKLPHEEHALTSIFSLSQKICSLKHAETK